MKVWWVWCITVAMVWAGSPLAWAAGPAMELAGSSWGFAAEQGEHSRLVVFGPEGLMSGHGGCNRYGGSYLQNDNELTIEGLISTRMACAPDVMSAETALLTGLELAHRFEATAETLKIFGADGALLLDLVRRDGG